MPIRPALAAVLVASCVTTPAPSPTPTPLPPPAATAAAPSPTATSRAFRDLVVSPAGEIRGDHVLAVEVTTSQTAGVPAKVRILDIPLNGDPVRTLVSYTQAPSALTAYDVMTFARQLSADGRGLVLSDPVEAGGAGLIVVDLVAGTARSIPLKVGAIQPAWSHDGRRIAFEGSEPAGPFRKDSGVWVVSATGGDERQILPSSIAAGSGMGSVHGWTPDGSGVIVTHPGHGLAAVDVTTGSVTRIADAVVGSQPVAVRATRPAVAAVVDETTPRGPPVGRVEVRDTTSAPGRTVARYGPDEGTFLTDPQWRPGGDEILLFHAYGQGLRLRTELVIVDAATGARRSMPTPEGIRAATWTADGRRIAYSDHFTARVRDADGSQDRILYRPPPAAPGENVFVTRLAAFAPR